MVVAKLSVLPNGMRKPSKPRWIQRQLGMLVARRLLTSLIKLLLLSMLNKVQAFKLMELWLLNHVANIPASARLKSPTV
jgi:hypothetical protein